MHTQSREQVAGEIALLHDPPANRDDDHSMGVPRERVDAHTLEVIRLLFKEKGLLFLAALLRQAQARQRALPGLGLADCAVITARTIRELATRISQPGASWSYDTTEKYLVIFCALGFLSKGKSPDGIEYLFPLQPYTPPATLDVLDSVIQGYRKKVQSFGNKVKRRFVVYLAQQKSPVSSLPVPVGPPFDLLGAEEDIEQILQEELGTGALPRRLLLKIRGVLRYRCQSPSEQKGDPSEMTSTNGRLPLQNGDPLLTTSDATLPGKSPILEQKGDPSEMASTNGRLSSPKGDFLPAASQVTAFEKSPIFLQKGDFSGAAAQKSRPLGKMGNSTAIEPLAPEPKKSPILEQKGDSFSGKSPANGPLLGQTVDSSLHMGNLVTEQTSHVNVITFIRNMTLNVDLVALFCCRALGENASKQRIYSKLFREVEYDVQAITAALIYVLVHKHDGTMNKPPAVFNRRCKDYHRDGIPDEVAALVDRYGRLPYAQLVSALRPSVPAQPTTYPSRGQKETPVSQAPVSLPPIPTLTRLPARIPLQSGNGLALEDARRLLCTISDDLRIRLYEKGLTPLADGSYAVLVDNTVSARVRQVAFYSARQWQAHSSTLQCGADLFRTDEKAPLRLQAAFLPKGGRP